MTTSPATDVVTYLSRPATPREELAGDARRGLTAVAKYLPPKHLYDARGSELFDRITELPEYALTRTETAILKAAAGELIQASCPTELVELGSGSSRKTQLLLGAMHRRGCGDRYAALDVSAAAVEAAAAALRDTYPWLKVRGYIGDFTTDLARIPRSGRRLIAFLGSTIGNLLPPDRAALFGAVAASLGDDDHFLLGADLVKPPEVLVPAYDDAAGVTARFTRNLLVVLNRELDGDLPVEAFVHRARWDPDHERMELSLEATRDVTGKLAAIDLDVAFAAGEHLLVEHSCKFRVAGLTMELASAGLHVDQVHTDDGFALLLARRADRRREPSVANGAG